MEHLLNGKPLAECTDDEIYREWEAGMQIDAAGEMSTDQQSRLIAVERELFSRPPASTVEEGKP